MSVQFDWQEGEGEEPRKGKPSVSKQLPNGFWWMVLAFLVVTSALGVWVAGKRQQASSQDQLNNQIQDILDIERQAILNGDGDLFMSVQANDDDWFGYQLRPRSQLLNRIPQKVTRAGQIGDEVWANISWQENGETVPTVIFFPMAK